MDNHEQLKPKLTTIKYNVFNAGKEGRLCASGSLCPADLGLAENASDLILIAAAKAVLKSRFSKNKVVDVVIERE